MWDPAAARPWAAPGGRLVDVGPPAGDLLAPDLFLLGNNSRKFSAHSEKLPRTSFLKQKEQKTGTGTGHLVNRLVP